MIRVHEPINLFESKHGIARIYHVASNWQAAYYLLRDLSRPVHARGSTALPFYRPVGYSQDAISNLSPFGCAIPKSRLVPPGSSRVSGLHRMGYQYGTAVPPPVLLGY